MERVRHRLVLIAITEVNMKRTILLQFAMLMWPTQVPVTVEVPWLLMSQGVTISGLSHVESSST